jgi:hypothetical protein
MNRLWIAVAIFALTCRAPTLAEEEHSHPAPERLGKVSFPTSCSASVQPGFERAVALLHSFAYTPSEQAFRDVAKADPGCAMAHWGVAMSLFHPLWSPPSPAELQQGRAEIETAQQLGAGTARERQFIEAAAAYYRDSDKRPPAIRAKAYETAMAEVAKSNPADSESQIFYALALIATAPPSDKTHANQKRAAEILEPLYHKLPEHPGLAHYLIHAYDSAELASRGLAAARAYSTIAPSAPHALHMPSHIFTRLGYWDDSIASNRAARTAAHEQGDLGEELHAMDYLTYAYLQMDRMSEAGRVLEDLRAMGAVPAADFKVGYAATAIPVRFAVERRDWTTALALEPLPQAAPHVAAIVFWARAVAQARTGHAPAAGAEIDKLDACLQQLRAAGNSYWATQVEVLGKEAKAWRLNAEKKKDAAVDLMRSAADEEDAVEKLPVTPGPIVPAREQLGELLLELRRQRGALQEFQSVLATSPGRRSALLGALQAAELSGDQQAAARLRGQLRN